MPDDHYPLPRLSAVVGNGRHRNWRDCASPEWREPTALALPYRRARGMRTHISSAAWGGASKMAYRGIERKDLSPIALQRKVFNGSYTIGLLSM